MDVTEADIADDVPSSSRQLSSWLRRTRQNKIRKASRPVHVVMTGACIVSILRVVYVVFRAPFLGVSYGELDGVGLGVCGTSFQSPGTQLFTSCGAALILHKVRTREYHLEQVCRMSKVHGSHFVKGNRVASFERHPP